MRFKIKQKKGFDRYRKPGYWVAVGTLAACTVNGGPAVLHAQSAGQGRNTPAEKTLPVIRVDIAAGPLGEAIGAFSRISGWTVTVPDKGMLSLDSPGVSGVLTAEQARRRLLAATGLSYTVTAPNQATLQMAELHAKVEVMSSAPVASPRYTEPIRNLPQTSTVIPRTIIEQQGPPA